jgi:hypothetical protein
VGLNAVIIAVTDEEPRILTVTVPEGTPIEGGSDLHGSDRQHRLQSLPTGPLDPAGDRTLELALRRWVRTSTGIELGYVEQLYTFGDRFRDPREGEGGPRVVSVAYLALVREIRPAGDLTAQWRGAYTVFPWEDWRSGQPAVISAIITPALRRWIEQSPDIEQRRLRSERASIVFGLDGPPWNGDLVLERYELLYELGLVPEATRSRGDIADATPITPPDSMGLEMAYDHRRIVATAISRIRGKIRYRPVIFELVGGRFTLLQLQRAVEALAGVRLHKQNFRRLVDRGGLVEGTGQIEAATGGRPAELFRFRREVLLERPAPGVGLPRRSSIGR